MYIHLFPVLFQWLIRLSLPAFKPCHVGLAPLAYGYWTHLKTADPLRLNCPHRLSSFWFWRGNPLERCLALEKAAKRAVPVSGALNRCPEGLYWPQWHNVQSSVILRMSQENAAPRRSFAQASQWQPVMQATTEHQQSHKDRGESGWQGMSLKPLVKIKQAHIYRNTHKTLYFSVHKLF